MVIREGRPTSSGRSTKILNWPRAVPRSPLRLPVLLHGPSRACKSISRNIENDVARQLTIWNALVKATRAAQTPSQLLPRAWARLTTRRPRRPDLRLCRSRTHTKRAPMTLINSPSGILIRLVACIDTASLHEQPGKTTTRILCLPPRFLQLLSVQTQCAVLPS